MGKIKRDTEPNVLKIFAHSLGTEIKNWRLEIPEKFGNGYCTGFVFNEHIRMLILNYELNEELVIKNPDINVSAKTILFKFKNIFPSAEVLLAENDARAMPTVLIATTGLGTEVVIPIHTNTATINIEVDADYLNGFFDLSKESPVLQGLLQNTQPLFFEQMIYPSLQKVVDEIVSEAVEDIFKLFFLRVKAEELVCRLLMELEKRDAKQLYALNSHDIAAIYKVKNQMLAHLDTPPIIKELAVSSGMSPTKFKRLFKQIFGKSSFNYYQDLRIKEASLLLKQQKLSVADVGYKLGFTNLSHFSKVFEANIGMKPKQFSKS
ncbi:AraC family transcriptional regulator [Pedobacter sp. L105]|uniref:helix-turn-helix domain-containing protein n=1 Tax=Pedobacter sp. L105 TaxID=1641871 RepID=UPI00131D54D0|nr:AraC family transcriptional regulator [Pedobacter sp. L105]